MESVDYKRRKEGNRTEGAEYQHNLTLTTWLRADKIYGGDYLILPEWDRAGVLDDVVLKYKDEDGVHYRFLQAKHSSNEAQTLTFEQLFNKKEFKIEKYFESYKDFREHFKDGKIEDLILFTNLGLHEDVEEYVTALEANDPIFQFEQKKKNGKNPIMHKFNSDYIEAYEDRETSKLRRIVKSFIKYCVDGHGVKQSDDLFIECQFIITQEIANVKMGKFHSNFIDCKGLSEGTEQFRKIFMQESATGDKTCSSPEAAREYLESVKLKLPPGFGKQPRQNKKPKDWPIWTPEKEELFREFCGLFKLATSQPNDRELIQYIESECKRKRRQPGTAALRLKKEICDWYNNNEVLYQLDSISLKTIMNRTETDEKAGTFIEKTKRNIDELAPFKLQFKNIFYEKELNHFLQQSEGNVFHLNTKGHMNVSLLKLFHCLENLQQFAYLFCPRAEDSKIDEFVQVFRDSELFKILVCEIESVEMYLEFIKKEEALNKEKKEKKLIFVTNFNIGEAGMNESHHFCTVADQTHFQDLMDETQKQLSERKISFQGAQVAFNAIYGKEIPPTHQDIESWGILTDNQIEMNKIFDKFDSSYYISRTMTVDFPLFVKDTIQQELGDKHIVTHNNEQIEHHPTKHVHLLSKVKELWCRRHSNGEIEELLTYKNGAAHFECAENTLCQTSGVYVISDMAGYGKTTTTSYLANEMQKQHPNGWVTRLQPSHLSFDEEDFKLTPEDDDCKYDAFLMDKLFKLTSPVERFVFKQYLDDEESKSQLFFLFDGFDEIDEDYQKVILKALKYLKLKRNVKFIGITTRPQYEEHLEEELQTVAYKLLPFRHENKITFLEKFWLSRGVKDQNERLREYSKRLIALISESISDEESELTGIPLQMRMLGEIYEKDAIEYLEGDLKRNEIVAVDLFGLYEQFIRKKEGVLVTEKLRLMPGAPHKVSLLKEQRKIHTEFARKVIFGEDYRDLKEQLKDTIDLGIIQQDRGEYSFIHRTFAEFLAAKYFLDYTLAVLIKVNSGQLLKVMFDWGYSVVRKFINSQLDYKKLAIELKNPEYREAILNIKHQQFEDAMKRSLQEGTIQILCFLLELYWYSHPKEMKDYVFMEGEIVDMKLEGGLLFLLIVTQKKHHSVVFDWFTSEWLISDQDALLQLLCYLIENTFSKYKFDRFAAEIVTDLQDKLEEKQLLSEERLKGILFAISFDLFIRCDKRTIDYLKHLKMKHEQLFYSFLRKKDKFVQEILSEEGEEIYEWIGEKDDPNLVFDILVVSLFKDTPYHIKISNLERYLNLITKYIRQFDEQKLVVFKNYLSEYAGDALWGRYNSSDRKRALQLFEFFRNHRDIISLEEFMQNMKIHKNLSFIGNCALWGWTYVLKFILDARDVEVEQVVRLQLERFESFDDKIKCILSSIRECSDEQLLRIARVKDVFKYTILSSAIRDEDKLRIDIFLSWITSGELFNALMENVRMKSENIRMVVGRFPQYKMRFFEINKNSFVQRAQYDPDTLSILDDENIINKEEFLRLIQLQDDKSIRTILFRLCRPYNIDSEEGIKHLRYFLNMMKRKCTLDDIVILFRMKDVKGKSIFYYQMHENDRAYSSKIKTLLCEFFDELNIVELREEINITEETKKKIQMEK